MGNKVLDAFFGDHGYRVVNLGVMVSQDEFMDAALQYDAAAILVSSLYGHAEIDCIGFRDRCRSRGLDPILLYIGGNLVVGKCPREVIEAKFQALGFDRVFMPSDELEVAANYLQADLARARRARRKQLA